MAGKKSLGKPTGQSLPVASASASSAGGRGLLGMGPSTATARFSRTEHLLWYWGQFIRNQATLCRLAATNRLFNDVFSRLLYKELDLVGNRLDKRHLALFTSRHLPHVERFSVVCEGDWSPKYGYFAEWLNDQATLMLNRMPRLATFEFLGCPITKGVLEALSTNCPGVRNIHVDYGETCIDTLELGRSAIQSWEQIPEDCQRSSPFLRAHPIWRSSACPLTKYPSNGTTYMWEDMGLLRFDFTQFLNDLGKAYEATGKPPLRLRSLELGSGLTVTRYAGLRKLTDLSYLEELYINGDNDGKFQSPIEETDPEFTLEIFDSKHCPRLRRVVFDRLCRKLQADILIRNHKEAVRQIAVLSTHYDFDSRDLSHLCTLGHEDSTPRQVRMIGIELDHYLEPRTAHEILDGLVAINKDCLEGLFVHCWTEPDLLSRLDAFRLLSGAVANLPKLTQISVQQRRELDSRQGHITDQILVFMAKSLAEASRNLRYINLSEFFWEARRDLQGNVQLNELDLREQRGIELFDMMRTPRLEWG